MSYRRILLGLATTVFVITGVARAHVMARAPDVPAPKRHSPRETAPSLLPEGFGPDMIVLAAAIGAGAVATAFISLALWEMVFRAPMNRYVVDGWRRPKDRYRSFLIYFVSESVLGLRRVVSDDPEARLTQLPEAAYDLAPAGLAAQAAARLQALIELASEKIRPFLTRASDLTQEVTSSPEVVPADGVRPDGAPVPSSAPTAVSPAQDAPQPALAPPRGAHDLPVMVDRAVDDLHARLTRATARARYALNIGVGVLMALIVQPPTNAGQFEQVANLPKLISALVELATFMAPPVLTGVMIGLVGVVMQGWLMRGAAQ